MSVADPGAGSAARPPFGGLKKRGEWGKRERAKEETDDNKQKINQRRRRMKKRKTKISPTQNNRGCVNYNEKITISILDVLNVRKL